MAAIHPAESIVLQMYNLKCMTNGQTKIPLELLSLKSKLSSFAEVENGFVVLKGWSSFSSMTF